MPQTVRTQIPPPKGSIFEITLADLRAGDSVKGAQGDRASRYRFLKHRFVLPGLVAALVAWALVLALSLWPGRVAPSPGAVAGAGAVAGEEVPEDLRFYHLQAEAGDVGAMRMLGLRYCYGLGAPMDSREGVKWLRKAAAIGSSPAQQELAAMGIRVP